MDERLDYFSSEEMLRKVSSQYMVRHNGSADSLERESSRLFLKYKDYHLHLVEKTKPSPAHARLPASKMERLAYYRQYVNTFMKTQLVAIQSQNFNQVYWYYIFNILLKSMPHTYVHMFLASYSPEEHVFVPKMVPLFYGFKFAMLLASTFEVFTCFQCAVFIFAHIVHGVMYKSPWNSYFYILAVSINAQFVYIIILWIIAVMSSRLLTKKMFWKILSIVQGCVIIIEVMVFLYIIQYSFRDDFVFIPTPTTELKEKLSLADIDLMSEPTSAPPVVHVLTSRSNQEVHLTQDSSAIILSNAMLYIFRGLLSTHLLTHCQHLVNGPIQLDQFSRFSWYFLWPIFFTSFSMGDFYFIIFLILNFAVEMMSLAVTYYCWTESIVCEWKWIKGWMIASATLVIFSICHLRLDFDAYIIFNLFCKAIVTLAEIIAVYGLYPVGRLVDDVMFHTGKTPTKFMILAFRLMPVYYMVKVSIMMEFFISVLKELESFGIYRNHMWSWSLVLVPFVLGALYIFYKYTFHDKRGFHRMFVPLSTWGPQDMTIRGLRKLYDSRQYIGSQALRSLSRHLFEKSESKAFQLDLNYDLKQKSVSTSSYRIESEKQERREE